MHACTSVGVMPRSGGVTPRPSSAQQTREGRLATHGVQRRPWCAAVSRGGEQQHALSALNGGEEETIRNPRKQKGDHVHARVQRRPGVDVLGGSHVQRGPPADGIGD